MNKKHSGYEVRAKVAESKLAPIVAKGRLLERPPNYESLTLTNSSAEFGHHSLSSSNDNFQP
jgi:hypothetical protein